MTKLTTCFVSSTIARALEFGVGGGELDAEGRRLGVDAVAAADGDGILVFKGAGLEGREGVTLGVRDSSSGIQMRSVVMIRLGRPASFLQLRS